MKYGAKKDKLYAIKSIIFRQLFTGFHIELFLFTFDLNWNWAKSEIFSNKEEHVLHIQ